MADDGPPALESRRVDDASLSARELVAARNDVDAAIADAEAIDGTLVTLIRAEQARHP